MKATIVEVKGDKLLVHYTQEIHLNVARIMDDSALVARDGYPWLRKKGFVEYIPDWSGYGHAKDENGDWFYVDNADMEVIRPSKDPRLDNDWVKAKAVHVNSEHNAQDLVVRRSKK